MIEQEERFEKALRSSKPVQALRTLVLQFAADGHAKKDIYILFFKFFRHLKKSYADREADEVAVTDVMDALTGHCWEGWRLLPDEDDVPPVAPEKLAFCPSELGIEA